LTLARPPTADVSISERGGDERLSKIETADADD
jgi:hypothetical protein